MSDGPLVVLVWLISIGVAVAIWKTRIFINHGIVGSVIRFIAIAGCVVPFPLVGSAWRELTASTRRISEEVASYEMATGPSFLISVA